MEINIDKYSNWPMFEAWLNELISCYETNAIAVTANSDGTYQVPNESDINTRVFSIANSAESIVNYIDSYNQTVSSNLDKQKYREDNSVELRDTSPVLTSSIRRNPIASDKPLLKADLLEWFENCFACDSRLSNALDADIVIPEFLLGLSAILDSINLNLDFGVSLLKPRFSLCQMLDLTTWCLPDLLAFRGVLLALINRYSSVDPYLEFSWIDLIGKILLPILEFVHYYGMLGFNLSSGILACIKNQLYKNRAINFTPTSFSGNLNIGITDRNNLPRHINQDITVPIDNANNLMEVARFLGVASEIDIGIVALQDFERSYLNTLNWLSSKIEVLRSQSIVNLGMSLNFVSVLLTLSKLIQIIELVISNIGAGRKLCTQDSNGLITPATDIVDILIEGEFLPPWIEVQNNPLDNIESNPNDGNVSDKFIIIDNSNNTSYSDLGCLGKVSKEEKDKIVNWVKDLEALKL